MQWRLIASLAAGIGLILLVALTGDADAVDPRNVQENAAIPAGALDAAHTLGQTFVFHAPRLDAIAVQWIVSADLEYANQSRIVLHLRRRVDDSVDLATASVALSDLHNGAFVKFSFPPITASQDQSFYFFLDASRAKIMRGYVGLWASDERDYPDGQLYVDGVAAHADLAFRAYYEPDLPLALEALRRAVARYSTAGVFALGIFFLPGLALVLLTGIFAARHPVEIIALAGGLGLAAPSAASILLLALGAPVAWLGVGIAAAFVTALVIGGRKLRRLKSRQSPRPARRVLYLLAALALLSLAVGFLQIRDTTVPLWKDSPVHAGHIAAILAQGHIATDSFYHFGFHSIAALLVQSSGATIPAAMLVIGQLLLTQTGLSVFLLSQRLTGSDAAALASAACVWFLSPTPAYWITWGRYPLLLGGAILPLTLLFIVDYLTAARFDARAYSLLVIASAGLAFAHVRLAAFALVFAAIDLAYLLWRARDTRTRWSLVLRAALASAAGVLIVAIWLSSLSAHDAGLPQQVSPQELTTYALDLSTAIAVSLTQHGPLLLALAAIGAVAALARRRGALMLLAWFLALLAISALPVVGDKYLPAPLVVLIGFVPVSILVGDLADLLYTKTAADSKQAAVVWSATVLIVSVLGAREMISIVNPATILFTNADQTAMNWIEKHTPAHSKFLIDSAAWFGPGYSPTDGGWWIPYLTGRSIYFIDQPISADADTLSRWIDSRQIDLIYLGSRRGVLKRSDFVCQPDRYMRLYDQDGIMIFQVQRAPSTGIAPRAGCAPD